MQFKNLKKSGPLLEKFFNSMPGVYNNVHTAVQKDQRVFDPYPRFMRSLTKALEADFGVSGSQEEIEVECESDEGSHDLYGTIQVRVGDASIYIHYEMEGNWKGAFYLNIAVSLSDKDTFGLKIKTPASAKKAGQEFLSKFDQYGFKMKP